MFKKRTINSKPIADTNVVDEIKHEDLLNHHENLEQNKKNEEKVESFSPQQHLKGYNKMQEKQVQNEDEQFLQRLKRDKKLNDLFADLQAQQKDNLNQQQKNETKQDLKPNKQYQPIKIAPYVKKRINFTFTQQSDNIQKVNTIKSEQKINLKPKQKQQKKQTEIEMQDIFRQIRQHNKKEEQIQMQILQKQKQQNVFKQQINTSSVNKPIIKANQFIIEDEDGFVQQIPKQQFAFPTVNVQQHGTLKVAVDYQGNFSPQLSQHEDQLQDLHHQDDFQDQLIKKTLTRHNYLKLQQKSNLKQTKISHKKQKLFNIILKTSWTDIQTKLSLDINEKLTKKNELIQQMKYLQERESERISQIGKKRQVLKQLQTEQKKLKKVIYFLCYFGDQVCGKNESTDTFFNDLTTSIIDKIEKISDKINIEEFMEKRNRQELKEEYKKGRKKIKGNQKADMAEEINEEENQDDDDDEDGEFFMQQDGF